MTFKVDEEDARLIRELAKQEHTSLSDFLRRRVIGKPEPGGTTPTSVTPGPPALEPSTEPNLGESS